MTAGNTSTFSAEASAATPTEESIDRAARAQEARDNAARFLREQKFSEARRALEEAESIEMEGRQLAEAQLERDRAVTLMAAGKYTEAKEALERAEALENNAGDTGTKAKRFFSALGSRIRETTEPRSVPVVDPVAESVRLVSLYAKIAAGVGLIPGGLINFAAILAVQVIMVTRIARAFGQTAGKDRIRGVILSLFGSAIPTIVGHGAGFAVASIPALIAGTIVYFVATPVLAYALTRAVGNTFTMHFESGGTLLTFDPKKFGDYFVSEFRKAGGTTRTGNARASAGQPVTQPV